MPAETSQTLDRGLRVLEVLAASPNGRSVTALAAEVGVNRTVVYRLVATLEQHGLARRDAAGLVHVGLAVLSLARSLQPVLRELAGPVLRRLAEELGMTAHLTLADGGDALAIAVVEPSWTDFHVGYRVGARHPLGQGAAGRAILLGRSAAAAEGAVGPAVARPGSAADARAVSTGAALDETAAETAYAVTSGELQPGARGLAAPVLGVEGLEASVGIVTLGDLEPDRVAPHVLTAAAEVAARLS